MSDTPDPVVEEKPPEKLYMLVLGGATFLPNSADEVPKLKMIRPDQVNNPVFKHEHGAVFEIVQPDGASGKPRQFRVLCMPVIAGSPTGSLPLSRMAYMLQINEDYHV